MSTDFLKIARDSVTAEEFLKIWREAVSAAMLGDQKARDFVAKYLLPDAAAEDKTETVRKIVFTSREVGKIDETD